MQDSLLVLIFFLSLTLTHSQKHSLNLSHFNCLLSYQQTSVNSLHLNFCQDTTTRTLSFYYTAWNQCSEICCGLSPQIYPQLNQWSLSQCQQRDLSLLKKHFLIKILVIVLSAILGSLFLLGISYKLYRICRNRQIFVQGQTKANQTADINTPIWLQDDEQANQTTLSNINNQQSYECPICLEQNTNLITPCAHRFHTHCLLSWLTKNRNCPLCKRTNLEDLKLKCRYCQKKYILLYMPRAIFNIEKWTHFDNSCGTCILPLLKLRDASTKDLSLAQFNSSFIFDENQGNQS